MEVTRGMAKEGEQLNTDELHLRAFWIQWDKLMRADADRMANARRSIGSSDVATPCNLLDDDEQSRASRSRTSCTRKPRCSTRGGSTTGSRC